MAKCKNCETEENGYGTILDKRGYCYKPSCQSCSYDEVEQQNTRLQSELDKQIKDNRKLVKAVKFALNFLACPDVIDEDTCNEQLAFDELRNVLKEVEEEE